MKPPSYRLLVGALVFTILGLIVVAAGLGVAIADKGTNFHSTNSSMLKGTVGQWTNLPAMVNPTVTNNAISTLVLPLPTKTPTLSPSKENLSLPHPKPGANLPPCSSCHQSVHRGGG
jgi:hypothetical protein